VARYPNRPPHTIGTFYTNLRRYLKESGLPPGGVHIFRHSRRCRDAGEPVEEVSRFLHHSSLAVTTPTCGDWRGKTTRVGRRWPS
jgi:integrase